eukprot:m.670803 g.670803  ORF g.670803 m.670803 type:complete len:131 (-) comp22767_c0_seq15:1317-1709(-)
MRAVYTGCSERNSFIGTIVFFIQHWWKNTAGCCAVTAKRVSPGGPSFQPVCEESEECRTSAKAPRCLGPDKPCTCKCSGDGIGDLPMLEMVDMVQLPAGLVPGSYVLGWRWDCEESTQVWTSCSDVTITA